MRKGVVFGLLVVVAAVAWTRLRSSSKACAAWDIWYTPLEPTTGEKPQFSSLYLTMRDGTMIAVDYYLPASYREGDPPLPTMLHLTRYNRNWKIRFPFSLIFGERFNLRTLKMVERFVPAGYAWVTVDVRGTGASYGSRPCDLLPQEVADYQEILQWVRSQPWCNGKVGSAGISYDGIAAAQMAAFGGVDAIAILYSPADIYEDICAPGGLLCTGFIDDYSKFVTAGEQNRVVEGVDMPLMLRLLNYVFLDGVAAVVGEEGWLVGAIDSHRNNWDFESRARSAVYRDDVMHTDDDGRNVTIAELGTTADTVAALRRHKVAVYSVAGYYDAASVRAAARLFVELTGPEADPRAASHQRMTLGPYTHGGRARSSPHAPHTDPCFDLPADVRRFMDHHLRGIKLPPTEKPIQYFAVGEERWHGISEWPPKHEYVAHYFNAGGKLTLAPPKTNDGVDTHIVDPGTSSGFNSRWNLVQHILLQPVRYPDRAAQGLKSLTYTGPAVESTFTILGAPAVCLEFEPVGASDAAVFAYLEDVDHETNAVHYITEGELLVSHRPLTKFHSCAEVAAASADRSWDPIASFVRGYTAASRRSVSGKVVVPIFMEPIAYRVPAGHSLRVTLAGADTDNFLFDHIVDTADTWRVHRSKTSSSVLLVPRAA